MASGAGRARAAGASGFCTAKRVAYRFQYAHETIAGPWFDLTNFISTGDVMLLHDPLPPSPTARFFRAVTP